MARTHSAWVGARVLAWGLFGWSTAAAAAAIVLGQRIGFAWSETLSEPVIWAVFAFMGALVASRHPGNAVGWLFAAVGCVGELNAVAQRYAALGLVRDPSIAADVDAHPLARVDPLPLAAEAAWFNLWVWFPKLVIVVALVPLVFPDGHPPTPRWRWVGWIAALGIAAVVVPFAVAGWSVRGPVLLPGDIEAVPELRWTVLPATVGAVLVGVAAVASVTAFVVRYRRSRGVERQQLKWFLFAVTVVVVVLLASSVTGLGSEWALLLAIAGVPVAAGIGILRYHLYDIDFLVNRTVVYVALTALVAATYVAVVTVLGRLLEPEDLAVTVAATAVVAVVFHPLRERVQRVVNRLLYGERDEPYAALSQLGRRLEAAIAADDILPLVTQSVAQALRVPYAAVELNRGDGFEVAASHGELVADLVRLDLIYQGETVGHLVVGARGPGESFSTADVRLLQDLARAAGVAAHAVRLTSDLQRSKERLVVAREEERQRLRRDLHDGLGPTLAGVALQLETVRSLVRDDPDAADALLARLEDEAQASIASIRKIVYGLRPPSLDELGLVGALREEGTRFAPNGHGLQISINATELPAMSAAVEVAAYRIALEGITNAARHSGATLCTVDVAANTGLDVDIQDDGRGLPHPLRAGVGLTSMRERVAELGGTLTITGRTPAGTRILAHLPLERP